MDFTKTAESLRALGYQVSCFETKEAAAAYLDRQIDGKTVGFGGSVTLQQLGLYGLLAAHNQVHWHWCGDAARERAAAQTAQVYLSSVNGLSESGELVNIDGACNRVSATLYGHEKVYFVVGANKVAADFEAALHRARNIAAPKNAQRLGSKTPCAAKGDRCYDCKSPGRICRALSVLWSKPMGGDYEVVLIQEELGY